MTYLQAVAQMEGFYTIGSRPNRNRNPGDIEYGKFAIAHGAISGDPRFAIFADVDHGWECLRSLFSTPNYLGKTLEEVFHRYAPPIENNTNNYLAVICKLTGKKPNSFLTKEMLYLPPL